MRVETLNLIVSLATLGVLVHVARKLGAAGDTRRAVAQLEAHRKELAAAVAANSGTNPPPRKGDSRMNPVLGQLEAQVRANTDVEAAAAAALNGVAARIDAAVQKAIGNGATAEELAPVSDEVSALKASADALAAAIPANTQADPNAAPRRKP